MSVDEEKKSGEMTADPQGKKKKRHLALRWAIGIFAILLAVAAALGAVAYNWVENQFEKMDHVEIDTENLGIDEDAAKALQNYRNILVLGIDKRKGEDIETCRSDAMIIVSVNKKTGKIRTISLLRDSFLELDEAGEENIDKLTHAHAYGGPENTIKAINKNLDLNITEFVRVDWQTVADAVDALGGIEVNIKDYEIDEVNKYIDDTNESLEGSDKKIEKSGKQTLNGIQAVAYCRIRKVGDGDSERASRMRTMMVATIKQARTAGFSKVSDLCDDVFPEITTNISAKKMMKLALRCISLDMGKSVGWPYTWDGAYLDGIWYDVPITLESNAEDLHKDVYGQDDYEPSDTVKEISEKVSEKSGYYEGQPVQITNE